MDDYLLLKLKVLNCSFGPHVRAKPGLIRKVMWHWSLVSILVLNF